MYPIEHININKIIDGYKEGRQFEVNPESWTQPKGSNETEF